MEKNIKRTSDLNNEKKLPHFFADTWWYAITNRMSDENFLKLVKKRQNQGFNSAQIVVGIPPEVGIGNPNAQSTVGTAFDKYGKANYEYLEFAKKRVEIMNEHNLIAIIYGAWGQQIDWIDEKKMCNWWKLIIQYFDELDVIYCLTGELDICLEPFRAKALLPNKTSQDIVFSKIKKQYLLKKIYNKVFFNKIKNFKEIRIKKWSKILQVIFKITKKPIIIHPLPGNGGLNLTFYPELLAANTFQTGHNIQTENDIWKCIMDSKKIYKNIPVINLEPWYEGIFDDFFIEKQLKSFWLSVASGAFSICYGAHGIWNVGDGEFLSNWGKATFQDALNLKTPEILGRSYSFLIKRGIFDWQKSEFEIINDELISITRISVDGRKMIYIPNIEKCSEIPKGDIFDVYKGEFTSKLKINGQIVIFI